MLFKKPELEDLPALKGYFEDQYFTNSAYTLGSFYLWSAFYDSEYAIINDMMICKDYNEGFSFSFPIGKGDPKPVIDQTLAYCEEQGIPFVMHGVTKDIEQKMIQMYGDVFDVVYDRDEADYVYLSEKLISLSGKKLHGKRNHINRFNANHTWSYEPITDENALECLTMLMQWKTDNCESDDQDMRNEVCAAKNAIMYHKELGFQGGLIRCEGEIIAFSLGEPLNEDTYVVHFEKAFSHIQGAYPIINQQFVLHVAKDYKYINREEDCGEDGLRQAKLSYRPEMMIEKAILKFKEKE